MAAEHYEWIIVGSGFGGSVSALRLAEKGYRVLLIEKGRRFGLSDFPETNWDLRRWMWMPGAGLRGFYQMSFLRHLTVLHGVGVGGGSLVYANTLPVPKSEFFTAPSWAHLGDWREELTEHYATAQRMLGAATNPCTTQGDEILREMAGEMGRAEHFHPTEVGVFFGQSDRRVPDPYFGGRGPERVGCTFCGACMTGCRVGAKNTLDRNYLYLAEGLGVRVQPETEVTALRPRASGGYRVEARRSLGRSRDKTVFTADRVVLAGGVMGTVPLLLAMQKDREGLPALSPRLGDGVRTNSEAIFLVVSPDPDAELSKGVAITSILHTDEHSHLEPVRYAAGSGFYRILCLPHAPGESVATRLAGVVRDVAADPRRWLEAYTVPDYGKQTQVLLYMRTLEGTMSLRLGGRKLFGRGRKLLTRLEPDQPAPQAFMEEATELARRFARKIGGVPTNLLTETLLGVPTTAHILGGCCVGGAAQEGVIGTDHRVFGYDGLYVIDGSSVSANPGVNPALTITALAERAMSMVPPRAA